MHPQARDAGGDGGGFGGDGGGMGGATTLTDETDEMAVVETPMEVAISFVLMPPVRDVA